MYVYCIFQRSSRPPLLLTPVASQGLPKTSLSVYNFLEELTELIKAVMLIVMFYYREKAVIKSSQGKSPIRQGPEGSMCKGFSGPLPVEQCGQCLILPEMMCDSLYRVLPTTEALVSTVLLEAQSQKHCWSFTGLTLCADLWMSPEVQLTLHGPRPHLGTISHIGGIDYLVQLKIPR